MRKRQLVILATATVIAVAIAGPATAAPAHVVSAPLVQGLAGPLGLAVGSNGTVYVAQAFAGTLTAVTKSGEVQDIAYSPDPSASIAGVAAKGRGTVTFTVTGQDESGYIGLVQRVLPNGKVKTMGDPGSYEEAANPDQVNQYGFQGLTEACAAEIAEIPEEGLLPYTGVVDSNSYAVALLADGSMAVADAGGNDIVRVAKNGSVSTIAVLPPIPFFVAPDVPGMFGLPECVAGTTYNFEPVPTDVEVGPDGMLYVSALPGGPEDDSLGARGTVFKVNPTTGAVAQIATGFLGATDLAVAPDGTIYVAELFGNRISKAVGGGAELVVELNQPAAVEYSHGKLYATTDAFGNGAVVTISL